MAVGYAEALRNAQLDEITARAGTSAILEIYSGTRPATGGAETTLLASLTCNASAFAPAASSGTLTANAISDDTNAAATGTASWARLYASDGTTHVMDMGAGESADSRELTLDNKEIVAGGTVSVTSFVVTAGNA